MSWSGGGGGGRQGGGRGSGYPRGSQPYGQRGGGGVRGERGGRGGGYGGGGRYGGGAPPAPVRPGSGSAGAEVAIRANHFLVKVADKGLCRYDVSLSPESKSRAANRAIIAELVNLHGKTLLGGKMLAYDGRKSLYTAGALPFESNEFVITVLDDDKKGKGRMERV